MHPMTNRIILSLALFRPGRKFVLYDRGRRPPPLLFLKTTSDIAIKLMPIVLWTICFAKLTIEKQGHIL